MRIVSEWKNNICMVRITALTLCGGSCVDVGKVVRTPIVGTHPAFGYDG